MIKLHKIIEALTEVAIAHIKNGDLGLANDALKRADALTKRLQGKIYHVG